MNSSIILASRSLWRKRLLARHGIFCKIHVSRFSEMKSHKNPKKLVLYNAVGKALTVARHVKNAIIIGVDTVGVLRGKILGKPRNRVEAQNMLKKLFGKTHRVITGLCVMNSRPSRSSAKQLTPSQGRATLKKKFTYVVTTRVAFRKVAPQELKDYLDSGEWKGKAGSYAIQGRAKKFVERIEGDVTNVVGVPVKVLKKILEKLKIKNQKAKLQFKS